MDGQNTNPQTPQANTPTNPEVSETQTSAVAQPAQNQEQLSVASQSPAESSTGSTSTEQNTTTPVSPTPSSGSEPVQASTPQSQTPQETPASATQPEPTPVAVTPMTQQPVVGTPDSLQQAAGVPAVPPTPKKGISIWLVLSFIVLLFAGIGGLYFYMVNNMQSIPTVPRLAYPNKATKPTVAVNLSPSPSSTQSAVGQGSVSGTLCYPSSTIPAGTITAKDMTTNKLYTQAYAGSGAAGSTTYTFSLPIGMYYLKFTPTQNQTVVGYYTDYSSCVGNSTNPNCSGQKLRPLLAATVSANMTVQNINLCDYYYPTNTPPQF